MSRGAAQRRGRLAERACALWLRLKGWRILARNLRTPAGEIDILARRGGVVAVVEVKHRRTAGAALAALGPRQQRRLARAAEVVARRPDCRGATLRLDLMWVAGGRPRHLPDAWRDGGRDVNLSR